MAFEKNSHEPVDELKLDPENPRLPSYVDTSDPESVFRFLALSSSIDELINAIGSNGYFDSEPLIGVRQKDGTIVIVEGNRRLTALKLLQGETFEGCPNRIVQAVKDAEIRPEKVAVSIYNDKADVLNYLGNKHIAGVKPWGALAKARYAKQLFDAQHKGDQVETTREVAKAIGSRRDFIARSLKALSAYEMAEGSDFFGLKDVDESTVKFSLLGTALDYEGVQEFVYDDIEKPIEERVIDKENLKLLFSWLFEKQKDGTTRIAESRSISTLSKVLQSENSLKAFLHGVPLDQAFRMSEAVADEYDSLAVQIQARLKEANGLVSEVDVTEDRMATASAIFKQARTLRNTLQNADTD